jgi:hypothetical protein
MRYEHNNMVDYGPLRVSKGAGFAKDIGEVIVSTGCAGVFSEDGKKLIAFATLADDGSFSIPRVPRGDYKLVVTSGFFCAANAKIRVDRGIRTKKKLIAVMNPEASTYAAGLK